jgi:hypothetical protein
VTCPRPAAPEELHDLPGRLRLDVEHRTDDRAGTAEQHGEREAGQFTALALPDAGPARSEHAQPRHLEAQQVGSGQLVPAWQVLGLAPALGVVGAVHRHRQQVPGRVLVAQRRTQFCQRLHRHDVGQRRPERGQLGLGRAEALVVDAEAGTQLAAARVEAEVLCSGIDSQGRGGRQRPCHHRGRALAQQRWEPAAQRQGVEGDRHQAGRDDEQSGWCVLRAAEEEGTQLCREQQPGERLEVLPVGAVPGVEPERCGPGQVLDAHVLLQVTGAVGPGETAPDRRAPGPRPVVQHPGVVGHELEHCGGPAIGAEGFHQLGGGQVAVSADVRERRQRAEHGLRALHRLCPTLFQGAGRTGLPGGHRRRCRQRVRRAHRGLSTAATCTVTSVSGPAPGSTVVIVNMPEPYTSSIWSSISTASRCPSHSMTAAA